MTYEEVERYEYYIERVQQLINKAKALMDRHYTEHREERYENLIEYKYQLESDLESVSESCDEPDDDIFSYRHRRTYAPMEGFYY